MKLDDQWRQLEGWTLPDAVLERMAPMSNSGGGWGDDGLLYLTGHDRPEVYALRLPKAGSSPGTGRHPAHPFEGQAIDWDPKEKRLLWGISRKDRKAIAVTIPKVDIRATHNNSLVLHSTGSGLESAGKLNTAGTAMRNIWNAILLTMLVAAPARACRPNLSRYRTDLRWVSPRAHQHGIRFLRGHSRCAAAKIFVHAYWSFRACCWRQGTTSGW